MFSKKANVISTAAGSGTKKAAKTADGETIFHRQLRLLSDAGIQDFIVTTGPFAEQLQAEAADFPELKFTFVPNEIYDKTNYIYSMYKAREFINDDMIFLHGDLVFSRSLVQAMLGSGEKNAAAVNFTKALPEKDFKGRVRDGKVMEVSIHIFDEDCYAFQPFYKLEKAVAEAWVQKVIEFIDQGQDKCYAENAFNQILPQLDVRAFSYENYYIDEIDNPDDYTRVSREILPFDAAEG